MEGGMSIELKLRPPRDSASRSLIEAAEHEAGEMELMDDHAGRSFLLGGLEAGTTTMAGGSSWDGEQDDDDLRAGGQRSDEDLLREFDSKKRKRNVAEPYYYRSQRKVVVGVLAGLGLILVVLLSVMVGYRMGAPDWDTGSNGNGNDNLRASLKIMASGVLPAMDWSVDPCHDFYRYSCGAWLKNTTLPSDRSSYTRSLSSMSDHNQLVILSIIEDEWPLISTFYRACMDNETLDQLGFSPLKDSIDNISAANNLSSLFREIARLHTEDVSVLFYFGSTPDPNIPTSNVGALGQAGLGLPDRDYYLSMSNSSRALREQYKLHIHNLMNFINSPLTLDGPDIVLNVETQLANISIPRTDLRDPHKTNGMMSLAEIKKEAPNIDWDSYFSALNDFIDNKNNLTYEKINVQTPAYFQKLSDLIINISLSDLKAYVTWQLIYQNAAFLSSQFRNESSRWANILSERQQAPPRWKQCVSSTQRYLGFLIGHYFVQSQFPNGSKEVALALVQNLQTTFATSINKLEWMDKQTKDNALKKLSKITNKIGYPDKWPIYESAYIQPNKFFQSILSLRRADSQKVLLEIGKPVDKSEWYMFPQEVNAYYSSLTNEIAFPAGILANPVFSRTNINAMNYGGIGMVIGHEITHGFDDHGSKFDGDGRMVQWWSNSTLQKFDERATCVSEFFSKYEPLPGLYVNGNLTNGENIADMGGLKAAYYAFQAAKETEKQRLKITDDLVKEAFHGLTNDQLFFVSFAQLWCGKMTDAQLRISVTTDPHSPYEYRVNGPASNSAEFAAAFSCPKGARMNPERKCSVW